MNLTNRCPNACDFCLRTHGPGVGDAESLWLDREPTRDEIWEDLSKRDLNAYPELVFCGYGEPTCRLEDMLWLCGKVRQASHISIRVNTNGLANREYGRDVVPELENLVDVMSISLNEASAEKYDAVCHSIYGPAAFDEMLDFARRCAGTRMDTVLSVVDVISPEDIAVCREIAEKVGARLRVREYSAE